MFNPEGRSVVNCHYAQRLIIKDLCFNATKSECLYRMQEQLAVLNYSTLFDDSYIEKLVITGDGETYKFSGDIIDENTAYAIRSLTDFSDIRVDLQYSYTWYNETPEIVASPDKIVKALLDADDKIFDNIFFAYQEISSPRNSSGAPNADIFSDPGACHVYGWQDGKLYKGGVEPVEFTEPPYESKWTGFADVVSLSDVSVDGENGGRIKELCEQLGEIIGSDDSCEISDNGKLSFSSYEFNLNTFFDVERFSKLIGELKVLCKDNGTLHLMPRFWDHNSDNLRMLFIDFNDDGTYKIKLSEIPKGQHKFLNGAGYTDPDKTASIILTTGVARWHYTECRFTQVGDDITVSWKAFARKDELSDEGSCVFENKKLSDFVNMFNAITFADHKDFELDYAWKVLFVDENDEVTGGFESGYWHPEVIQSAAKMLEVFLGATLPETITDEIF